MSTNPPHTLSPTVKNRIARSSPAVRVACTCADLAAEAFRRDFAHRLDGPTVPVDDPRPRAIGVGQLVRAVGLEIEELGHRLVAADVACLRAQARQRGPRAHPTPSSGTEPPSEPEGGERFAGILGVVRLRSGDLGRSCSMTVC